MPPIQPPAAAPAPRPSNVAPGAGRMLLACAVFAVMTGLVRQVIDIGNYYANYHKIQSRLGWQPKTSFRAGLEHTLAFYGRYSMHYWQDAHAA